MFIQNSLDLIDIVVESHIVIVDIFYPVFVFLSAHDNDVFKINVPKLHSANIVRNSNA